MRLFEHDDDGSPSPASSGRRGLVVAAVLIVLGGAAALVFWSGGGEEPVREAAPPPPAPAPSAPEPTPEPPRPAAPAPRTGTIEILANVDDATVYLDGAPVGPAPHVAEDLPPGEHTVRVEKQGYEPFETKIDLAAGRHRTVRARLAPPRAALRVTSDVPGASVFLDREYVGTTPLELADVEPGTHQLMVSAEGHDVYAETIDLGPGEREVAVRFREARLEQTVAVVHKHRFGSCEGRLVATTEGLRYETDNENDGFAVPFSALERFEIDYLDKNLKLKIRGGRTYNFTEKSGDADALFVFHREVDEFRKKTAGATAGGGDRP